MTKTLKARIRRPFSRTASFYRLLRASRRLEVSDGKYQVRLARSSNEVESALALRYRVFNVEMGGGSTLPDGRQVEFDKFDFTCRHLIVIEKATGRTVGTYRISSIESAKKPSGFYSFGEFTVEDLPHEILVNGMEIGRACIAPDHRNTKVLFLLWKGLATYLQSAGKRYMFGCCSIFSTDPEAGRTAYHQLKASGNISDDISVQPRRNAVDLSSQATRQGDNFELPSLFNMYLRIGAKICSPPMIDRDFGSTDFFVVFDLADMNEKYRKMFFGQ